jgi:S-DNA-T family DNA segregation ATPase FtsK/SpoIIIE
MDEVHELFMHPTYGKEAADLVIRLIKRDRKYGVILKLATQAPTKDSIPRDVTRQASCGVAFSVQDHVANDGLLGTGKYKAGITATELRPNKDRGTCVTVGITDNSFELIRAFYIPFEDGIDEVTPIITRAMNEISELRHTLPPTGTVIEEPPDHLADIWEVLQGEARVRTTVVLSRLAELDNNLYGTWTTHNLSEFLRSVDVPIGKSQGQSVVRAQSISEALDAREDT